LRNVLNDDSAANLQKILQISTSIFICLSTECSSLHYVDEAWLGLSSNSWLLVLSVGPTQMFSVLGAENSRRVFSAMTSQTDVKLLLDLVDSD
jgi:hypothetical protein